MLVSGIFLRNETFLDYGLHRCLLDVHRGACRFMTKPATARKGNMIAAAGMAIAVVGHAAAPAASASGA